MGACQRQSSWKALWAASMASTVVVASPPWTVVMTLPVAGLSTTNCLFVSLDDRGKVDTFGKEIVDIVSFDDEAACGNE